MMRNLLVLLLLLWSSPVVIAQDAQPAAGAGREPADVPFGVGERLDYRVKFGPLRVGKAQMMVEGVERIEGHPVYHLYSIIEGSTPFYKLVDKQESWLDVAQLASRRYLQDSKQGSYERYRVIDFDLENLVYSQHNGETGPIPAGALDDCSFVYFVRSLTLEVGETYEWNRYFRLDRNPVILKVLRREEVDVPAGEFSTIVVRPIIKSGGIFSEGGEAEIYITDDENRVPVKLVTKLKVGSIILELTDYAPGDPLTEAMLETM
ncbi:MAG: DUF3108 domain-containing protein [Gemmatimonadales bacterium]|jgi:hypothetical protein